MSERVVDPATTPTSGGRRAALYVAPVLVFAAIAALFALALTTGDPAKLPSALIGRPAPDIALGQLGGLVEGGRPVPGFKTSDLGQGKVAVVNFWASWCVPCIEEHPLLIEAGRQTGVAIYGINYKDQEAAARRFLGRFGNPFTAVGVDGNGRAAIEWGVYGVPETFVIDKTGRLAFKHVGPLTRQSLEGKLIPAIREAMAR
jgi:cytochrome c biogenesis protein CcmG/thiol:disulfide interchange protein DsbE